ncbi:MAG: glycoside hydrolase family 97 protein, partial [Bacteroidales bacterium]|nr:glycoside hydrolase family 97 protein [Bacteroidales bacterium]
NLVMARQDLEGKWTIAGVNAASEPFKTKIDLSLFEVGQQLSLYLNNEVKSIKINKKKTIEVIIPTNGGVVIK